MLINGIDLDGLADHAPTLIEFPKMVPGRTIHIDADFLAYQCSSEGKGEKTWDDMQHNAAVAVETLKNLGAAEFVHLHLTPKESDKGGRRDIAIQREYQGNRKDKEKPRYLELMRDHLATAYPGTLHVNCEADDGMSSAQYAVLAGGSGTNSIIASKDKDLRMVPGYQLDWDTGAIHCGHEDSFGALELVNGKLKGYGQIMFWGQMLTGDTADNIQGLPKVCGKVLNTVDPTKETQKLSAIAMGPDSPKKEGAIKALAERSKACGPALAHKLLSRVTSNGQAFQLVRALYRAYGELHGFVHWKTGDPVPWQQVFVSEAQLLWMRREGHNRNCVINWWKEIVAK